MVSAELVKEKLRNQRIELASWSFGNTGTRFKVFPLPGAARTAYEKVDDAATVHRFTGVAPSVALHIPWDAVDDYVELAKHAASQGVRIGAINPNLFQDEGYRLGSLCHPSPGVRAQALAHVRDCLSIAESVGSGILSLWLADGTNYPGQDSMAGRQERLHEGLQEIYRSLPQTTRLLLEYKLFEPAFYHTDIPDWGTSYSHCLRLGERAQVLVDTGHHAPGTNIEFIVAFLLGQQRLGGFHFNSRNYADDDLMAGAADPFELFLIMREVVAAGALDGQVAFMLDQCHNIEPKVRAQIRSVMNVQEATAKALLVDEPALARAQAEGDVLAANAILMDAFSTDVRPLLGELREEMGLDPDPVAAYLRSGYEGRIAAERGDENQAGAAGWGHA
jgi:L-rhamnose isomerase/sugar isomerase